ncbi:hypothetical protein K439DRAFT_1621639 [Ramaria rubella]|nr:hypothetical protein K439DRAFT_1621639 [Ramaria rubella]
MITQLIHSFTAVDEINCPSSWFQHTPLSSCPTIQIIKLWSLTKRLKNFCDLTWCLTHDMVQLHEGDVVEAVVWIEGCVCTTGTWVQQQAVSCWGALGLPLVLVHVSQLGMVEMGMGSLLSPPCVLFSAVAGGSVVAASCARMVVTPSRSLGVGGVVMRVVLAVGDDVHEPLIHSLP